MPRAIEPAAFAFFTALKIWIAAVRPVEGISWSIYDDRWFLQRAESIGAGEWLGGFNYLTLIKGPVYPLWIAFTSSIGAPLLLAQQLLYAIACLAMVRAVTPLLPSVWMRVTLFVVLVFNPMTLADAIATRVLREGFYPALALFVCAGAIGTVLHETKTRWAILTGVALAAFWHTREEGLWIAPLLLCAAAIVVKQRKRVLVAIGIPLLLFAASHATFRIINGVRYGIWEIVEFQDEHFLRAYASLTHVTQRQPKARVPVPKEVRERVYAVSPAFASLRPRLEGPVAADWYEPELGDMGAASFMWAFRQAAGEMGHYDRGGAEVHAFYDRITNEIAAARKSGRLQAIAPRASMLPPMLPSQYKAIVLRWLDGLHRTLTFADMTFGPAHSLGPMAELREYRLPRTRLAPVEAFDELLQLSGWVVHVDGALDVSIENANRSAVVKRLPSPGLYQHLKKRWKDFPPAKHAGYDIRAPLGSFMVLSLNGRVIERLALSHQPPRTDHPDVRMSVDRFEVVATRRMPKPRTIDTLRIDVMRGIGIVYQRAVLPLFALAAFIYLITLHRNWIAATLVVGLLGAVAARVLILATIDVTSFWVFTPMYEAPSHPLLLTALVLMVTPRK